MDILAYIASIFIGLALGLIGGGGSILTLPVLVYLFNIDTVLATAYSLFIVGATSVVGSFSYFKKGLVNIKTAIVFGIPSIISVFFTRAYIVPAIPQEIFSTGNFILTRNMLLMLLFATLMIFASYSMIKKDKIISYEELSQKQHFNYLLILNEGLVVGMLTGLVGSGGGFLIIPALVLLSKLPMKEAVGTSLVVIAAKSLIGFLGERGETLIDWLFLSQITFLAIIGIFIGVMLSKKINSKKLQPAFGWFILVMGIYIIVKETVLK